MKNTCGSTKRAAAAYDTGGCKPPMPINTRHFDGSQYEIHVPKPDVHSTNNA